MLGAQSQDPYFANYFNPNRLYFGDNLSPVVPLSIGPSGIDNDALRRVFGNEPQRQKKPETTVEIEKSTELAYGTSVEQIDNFGSQNIVNRPISTPTIPSSQTAQQLALDRQDVPQIQPNRQALDRQRQYNIAQNKPRIPQEKPEISLGRPTVAIPQSELNRPAAEQIFLGVPNSLQLPRDRPSVPEISLSRPSVAVPQSELQRPPVQPSSPNFNLPTQSAGFNNLLYSVTNFGVNLIKNIDSVHSGNVVVSPFSITSLLALLQQGANGETELQISNALQMTPESTASSYARVTGDIRSRSSRNVLRVANNVFIADVFAVNRDFKNRAMQSFYSEVSRLSYNKPEEAARQINNWVASRTNNKINQLIAPDALSSNTQMVLVNAIYFKGLWEMPFRVESTVPREFQLSSGQIKTAQFMRTRRMFKTGMDPTTNAKVIVLPFERDEYHLMVILPSQLMGIRSTIASLTDARLLSYLSFPAIDTELELPKFTVRSDTDLKVILQNMGITKLFNRFSELAGIGSFQTHSPQISSAVHSAVLSIDEQGGSAAAATAFAAVALSYDDPSVVFKVNRPFIAVLWDNNSALPLFMAKIEDPIY